MIDRLRIREELASAPVPSLGLYIHVPFCRVRCPFCPFYVQIHRTPSVQHFLDALKQELLFYRNLTLFEQVPVTTVYVGGGTPTTLAISELRDLLSWVREAFAVTVDAEVSIEAHPGTISGEELTALFQAGFNRLSLGIQSFDTGDLSGLGGRILSNTGTYVMVQDARNSGFDNINLDLMYGFPGHTLSTWSDTLDRAIQSDPEHISCYAFTVEEGTHTHHEISLGCVPMPDDESHGLLEREGLTRLSEGGYERYEISNFSRSERACRHNLKYWRGENFLGLGPSAQSYVAGIRFGNIADLQSYQHCLQSAELPLDSWDRVLLCQREREEVVFGLRLLKGVMLEGLSPRLRSDEVWNLAVRSMQEEGFLYIEDGCLRLTEVGLQHADTVAVALL